MNREDTNNSRLLLIDTSIRNSVLNVIRGMEADGHYPVIAIDVWRSPERQLELFNQGRSKLRWGFHNATLPDGSPGSLAADIICFSDGWDVLTSWWLHLGYHAAKNELGWGGYFGLDKPAQNALRQCITNQSFDLINKQQLGWDPAHVQTSTVTVSEAKLGKR